MNSALVKADIKHLISAFLCILLPEEPYCQKILYPEYIPPDIRWDNFLIKGGEASQKSLSLLLDSKGFIWSGTETGLYRFDGIRYVEYGIGTDNKGFAGSSVYRIFEDSSGTIWIGTSEALNKLDQKTGTFVHYFPEPAGKSDIGNFIREIREDSEGLLWVLTKKHIYSFDRRSEKFIRYMTDSLSWYPEDYTYLPEEQCYAEDRNGNKWFVTFRGLYTYNKEARTFRHVLPDPASKELKGMNKVNCVITDPNGILWIGTDGEGLLRWNDVQRIPEKIVLAPAGKNKDSFNAVSFIFPDNNGTVWSFGNGSFSNYSPRDKSIRNYIFIYDRRTLYEYPENKISINQVFQYNDGTIWFLYKLAGLMFRFDPAIEKLTLYRVPNYAVFQCIKDPAGSFWFACSRNNMHRLVNSQIPYLTLQVNNTSHVSRIHRGTFLEDNQHDVYFLFLPGIYVCRNFDLSSPLVISRFKFPDGDSIAGGGFKDSKGNLWFGDKSGNIARFEPLTRELTLLTHKKSPGYSEVVYMPLIREDKAGNIWVATARGLYRIDPLRNKLDHVLDFTKPSEIHDIIQLRDFLIDSQGKFWIITSVTMRTIRMPDLEIIDYGELLDGSYSFTQNNIRVEENSKGEVFILNSRYGVYQFDRQHETFAKASLAREVSGMEYFDLLIDRRDRLWIAHNRGITVYDPGNKSARLIKTPKLQFDIQSFQVESGKVLILNDNHLYVFEEDIPFNKHIPPVFLTRLLINGTDYNQIFPDDSAVSSLNAISLPYKLNTIGFEFAALNYLNPERNQYRYFMEGYDKDTTLVGQGMTADYKNMPPGRYKFWVTGSNNDGIWNPSGVTVDIRIRPPWYRTFVAWSSYVIFIVAMVWAYIRRREYLLRSEKAKLESEVKAATAELEGKNFQLAEMDRIKTHFFTDIAHEIRTPLSLILGPIETLSKEGSTGSRMQGMMDMMKRNAHRLMNLVNQLLDISRLDAGRMKITLTEDDVVKCIRILVYEFLSLAESKHIKYMADLPETGFHTLFDRDKTEKIVANLLSNAFKYTPRNGTVHCIVRIEPGKGPGMPKLKIRVVDTGPGIGKEEQFRIFDRFYRVEGHHEAEGHGTGIGLSIVREFVSLLHGEITLESTPGKGADFKVSLPLGKEHLSPDDYMLATSPSNVAESRDIIVRHEDTEGIIPIPGQTGRMKLLIIEDNEDLRTFIRQTLENEYAVLESENGKAGLDTAFTMMPDLIVTDIMMPDVDGMELCSILKNDERTSHIPVIMLTAKATAEDKLAGLRTGADDYIVKPFNMLELSTRIANLLKIRNKLKMKYSRFHLLEKGNQPAETVDDRFMMRIFKIITSKMADDAFDVGHLMEYAGMSRSHLSRKLKVLTGLSPGMLIRNIRIEKAAELLLEKTGNVTQIANSVGISNPSNFTKAFRVYFGVSPKNYLKRQISKSL